MELGRCARRLHEAGGRYWVPQCVSSPWMLVCWRGYVLCCECVVLGWRVVGGTNEDAKDATWQSACYIWSPSCVKVNCLTENTLRFHYGGQAVPLFEGSICFYCEQFHEMCGQTQRFLASNPAINIQNLSYSVECWRELSPLCLRYNKRCRCTQFKIYGWNQLLVSANDVRPMRKIWERNFDNCIRG